MVLLVLLSLLLSSFPYMVWSHARLMSPPSRSSMWRLGFPTKINFNDNQLYCGGVTIQWQKNGGKCGICGDPYSMPHPRENEAGGKYGLGIISEQYISGRVINVTVDVTTNHRGYFEFKLCPNNNPEKEATQECLDKHVLREAHGTGTRYYIGDKGKGNITVQVQLPKGLRCSQCVFQWTYIAGNNWGKCESGTSGLGCGPQETFRGCADIAIHKDSVVSSEQPNEIDVENSHREKLPHRHRDSESSKETTNTNHVTYAYEVTKQTRQNGSLTNFVETHDDSEHSSRDKKLHIKNGDFFPLSSGKPEGEPQNKPRNEGSLHGINNRRRYKYDDRQFYHFKKNDPEFRKNPFDQNWEILMNSNQWPLNVAPTKFKRRNKQNKKKYTNAKSRHYNPERHFMQIKLPFMAFSDADEEGSLSEGFSLGGRRYKDFWFL